MLKRSITGFFIVAITIGFFALRLVDVRFFNVFVFLMAIFSTVELTKALKDDISKLDKSLIIIYTCCVFVVATFIPSFVVRFSLIYIIFAIALVVLLNPSKTINSLAKTLFAFIYPTVPLLTLLLINYFNRAPLYILITVFTATSFTDVGAYLIGSLFKGKKLCPNVSPNKTISGSIGGILGGVLATFTTYYVLKFANLQVIGSGNATTIIFLIASGILFSITTQVGDLFESWLKRRLDVKDMGSLMPGHGGMLDRIDGLTFTSLTTFVLYSFLI